MTSYKYLIFIALAVVYAVAEESRPADDRARVKKHVYVAAAPAPVVAYSAVPPSSFSYAYSAYPGYAAYSYPSAPYPTTAYSAATYATYPTSYAAYPSYPYDDGKYYPGKYERTYYPAYKTAYPYY